MSFFHWELQCWGFTLGPRAEGVCRGLSAACHHSKSEDVGDKLVKVLWTFVRAHPAVSNCPEKAAAVTGHLGVPALRQWQVPYAKTFSCFPVAVLAGGSWTLALPTSVILGNSLGFWCCFLSNGEMPLREGEWNNA